MYKIISLAFVFIAMVSVDAQKKNLDSISVPLFTGCEKQETREDQFICLQKNITTIYTNQLQRYIYAFEYLNIQSAEAEIQFVVHRDGSLKLKYVDTNEPTFRAYNVLAFQDMLEYMQKNKLSIGVKDINAANQAADLVLKFPIKISLNEVVEESSNRLVNVLYDGAIKYEIVMTPTADFKIYEIKGDQSFYLGKYNSLLEIKNTLPYKNLMQDEKELVTLAESDYRTSKILLQTKNIFYEKDFYTLFIVSEVKGKRIKQLRKYTSLSALKDSPYYDWIIRN